MLSIIICPRSAQASLDQFRLLFENTIDNGSVSFCFWDENGTDVQNSLPELEKITRGHKHWRAIIALPYTSDRIRELRQTIPGNPYDYQVNQRPDAMVVESSIPLIRLCQMLGGVPPVGENFIAQHLAAENGDVDKTLLEQMVQEQQRKQSELSQRYQMRPVRPDEIWLLQSASEADLEGERLSSTVREKLGEFDSSLFWQRNRYPARCRFLTLQSSLPGTALYQEDLFRFWLTALTLAVNRFPAGTFEAYKLYRTEALIDLTKVEAYFSTYCNRLSSILTLVDAELVKLQNETEVESIDDVLPIINRKIEVKPDVKAGDDIFVPLSKTTLAGDIPRQEKFWWMEVMKKSIKALRKTYHHYRAAIDKASTVARRNAEIEHPERTPLSIYQLDEIRDELADKEKEALSYGATAGLNIKQIVYDLRKRDQKVQEKMTERPYLGKILMITAIGLVACLMGFVPYLIYSYASHSSSGTAGILAWVAGGLVILVVLGVLFKLWGKLLYAIHHYNAKMDWTLAVMEDSAPKISSYLSNCCSLLRGNNLVRYYENKGSIHSEQEDNLFRHSISLAARIQNVKDWMQDLNITLHQDDMNIYHPVFDVNIPPERNQAYLFDDDPLDTTMELPNQSKIEAPYPFLSGLDVERITVYEPERVVNAKEEEEKL